MSRSENGNSMTIARLEQMLDSSRRRLDVLLRQRGQLQKQLGEVDRKIGSLSGGRMLLRNGGIRAQNARSLVATMEEVLRDAGKPLPVREIVAKVEAAGYRSQSANFRALVNQTLIKDKRFVQAERGVYQLKK